MTIAEIHGKISETGSNISERMEDLLTSDIFGCLRYISPEKLLIPFLRTAVSFRSKMLDLRDTILSVHFSFWPWLTTPGCIPCEPDVVIGLETKTHLLHLVAVEAKYYSEISSEEDERPEPNNQLARELDNLNRINPAIFKWNSGSVVASRNLLYVTQDMSMPRVDLARSLDEFKRKRRSEGDIFWTSWRFLPSILENSLEREYDVERKAILEDMLRLLLRKGLSMFRGVEPCKHKFNLLDFGFYRHQSAGYHWPEITEPAGKPYTYTYRR